MIRARRERKHVTKDGGGDYDQRCYVDSLIDLQLPVESGSLMKRWSISAMRKHVTKDGGAVTTVTALDWTMAEIVKQNGVQSKILYKIVKQTAPLKENSTMK